MNKKFSIVLGIILVMILGVTGCLQREPMVGDQSSETMTAKIVYQDEGELLLVNHDSASQDEIYWLATEGLVIKNRDGEALSGEQLENGAVIQVAYDGIIMESYPAQLSQPTAITVTEQGDNLVDLYVSAIDQLYATDEGLNSDISMMAFDLTEVNNLTASEKSALVYLLGNAYQFETRQGTYEQLCEENYIDQEKRYFNDGILFELSDSQMVENQFNFSISKWRGGRGAIGSGDCVAERVNGQWSFTIGAMWIS